MSYKLVCTDRAVKDSEALEPSIKERIAKTLRRYEKDPLKYAEKLTDFRLQTYRFRIGD